VGPEAPDGWEVQVDIDGAVAVVTGGASGIGRAVVERLAAEGARPLAWDLSGGPGVLECDVSDPGQVRAAMAATVERLGPPTLLVTSAGVSSFQRLVDVDPVSFDRVFAVNVKGTLLCLQAFAAVVPPGQPGAAVCVSSISSVVPDRGMAAYCASKAAVNMLVRVAAAELGRQGIAVNAVGPGVTRTPMAAGALAQEAFKARVESRTPLGGAGAPEQVAEAVVGLARAGWVTGQVVMADGGLSLHSPMDAYGLVWPD
jgi:NAD(P)-dependent dehydrogenase (short-subunit alcohol dehydrogenase family)